MDTTELLKKVRKIEIKTRGLSRNLFTGGYHSAFKGRGMSFSEVRVYQPGDDVRAIDWNVTARTGEPHVKIFEEERELTVMLLVDVSASSLFGTTGQSKQDVMTEICAVLAFSAIANNDKVGALLFSDRIELFIPPQKGRQHTLRIIRELLHIEPSGRGTDLGGALQYARNVLRKRSVCFILSDFITADFEAPLSIFAKRHDCIGLHAWDPRERQLPDIGLVRIADAESGATGWVDTTDPAFRRDYQRRFDQRVQQHRELFGRAGADFLSLLTTGSYVQALLRFFEQRAHTISHG
ncbi:MAG: DUF58 domain-containing protein [Saprospirales bacterium]|nr:DUF58 domain-containing protein [Saprospirales bacterium]